MNDTSLIVPPPDRAARGIRFQRHDGVVVPPPLEQAERAPHRAPLPDVEAGQPGELIGLPVAELQGTGEGALKLLDLGERLGCFLGRRELWSWGHRAGSGSLAACATPPGGEIAVGSFGATEGPSAGVSRRFQRTPLVPPCPSARAQPIAASFARTKLTKSEIRPP